MAMPRRLNSTLQITVLMAVIVIGMALCLGAVVAAQEDPRFSASADTVVREQPGRTTLTGNVVLTINGVVVRADRAVIQDGEVTLDGNVHLRLPKPVYTAAAMRGRIKPEVMPYRIETPHIDTPIPQFWQPPARSR
jgi:lipopolysaccharide assembly outer membrane protein LptD (OstA)